MSIDQGELKPDFEAVQAHYDASASLIRHMIDWEDTAMYSCALWSKGATTLADAQRDKVDYTLAKLNLREGQRVVDIGCGYGFTLRRARQLYGIEGVGLTLSLDQVEEARRRAQGEEGLTYLLEGWEEHEGKYNAAVSIGMAEHVGKEKLPRFLQWVRQVLVPGGSFLLHMIHMDWDAIPRDRSEREKVLSQVSFLGTDIFPKGHLPTLGQLRRLIRESGFNLISEEFIGSNYPPTLRSWRENLERNRNSAIFSVTEDLLNKAMSSNTNLTLADAEKRALQLHEMYKDPYLDRTAPLFGKGLGVGQWHLQK